MGIDKISLASLGLWSFLSESYSTHIVIISHQLSHLEHMQNHESNSIYSQWAEASKDGLQELSYHLPLPKHH